MVLYFINMVLISLVVLIHYEALYRLSALVSLFCRPRWRVLVAVFGALLAHIIEVWLFAWAYWWMSAKETFGTLIGDFDASFIDCVYFSFTTYSSLGVGDIQPTGGVRFVAGLEALTGLVLIAWTASFVYLEMTRFFPGDEEGKL